MALSVLCASGVSDFAGKQSRKACDCTIGEMSAIKWDDLLKSGPVIMLAR